MLRASRGAAPGAASFRVDVRCAAAAGLVGGLAPRGNAWSTASGACAMTQPELPAPAQRDEFRVAGYVIVRGLFDAEEMAGLLRYARSDQRLSAEAYVRADATGGQTKLALRNELAADCPYAAVVRSRRVADVMEAFLGDEVYHYHHKMMLKEPRVGGAWEWHQDYGYWYQNGCLYPDMGSCLIAVDRASRANGCLQVLAGSHALGRIDHAKTGDQSGADPRWVAAAGERYPLVFCEMEPGDAIFFHANLLHRSDKNLSDAPRWSLICCYNTRRNDPIFTGGRHPNYAPLERWSDERVREIVRRAAAATPA
jgi:ectoine hydroxylase-related dioxygenase (phytanoyl-CoA dioxygenase family)